MSRSYYSNSIQDFCKDSLQEILGHLVESSEGAIELTQQNAWSEQIDILKKILPGYQGHILFEYSIPRMGRRIDNILIIQNTLFVLEFKIGEKDYHRYAVDQVLDYALDLKNFHETSRQLLIAPILVASQGKTEIPVIRLSHHNDNVLIPIKTNFKHLAETLRDVMSFNKAELIDYENWEKGRYSPTPTIIEAALALYNGHKVSDIARSDSSGELFAKTSEAIQKIIKDAKEKSQKSICFITGVPGAGKTLVGLDIATKNLNSETNATSVFLSGNGPLVAVLREAITRDQLTRQKAEGKKVRKGNLHSEVKVFIQNVHHYRDDCLASPDSPPIDHVAVFDEAQRAWDRTQTSNFMKRKKGVPNFDISEPEFLISCLDRHNDWAVFVCLVGGGQEINTGEAGISEWINAVNNSFPHWNVYISNRLIDTEYASGKALKLLESNRNVSHLEELHLAVSLRSFRSEHVSYLVKNLLDLNVREAKNCFESLANKYPIVLTRNLTVAKDWLREQARGNERYGIVVSSQAERLKPHAIDVKSPMDPIHWFLDGKEDVRSSYYLEDVATEFHVQGLELDWTCVTWDADFRYTSDNWDSFSFVGHRWNVIRKEERKKYQKNAYRVLLTRARQGMVIVVPYGDDDDHTRIPMYYDSTFDYLKQIGFEVI